jgi:hypothetical protein
MIVQKSYVGYVVPVFLLKIKHLTIFCYINYIFFFAYNSLLSGIINQLSFFPSIYYWHKLWENTYLFILTWHYAVYQLYNWRSSFKLTTLRINFESSNIDERISNPLSEPMNLIHWKTRNDPSWLKTVDFLWKAPKNFSKGFFHFTITGIFNAPYFPGWNSMKASLSSSCICIINGP